MAAICERHGILVVSDEVYQDLVFGAGVKHVPFAMLDDAVAGSAIVCTSPSKTFNIAGLSCANIFIPNERLRQAYRAQAERNGRFLVNTMGTAACEAAYRHGEPWADSMLDYVRGNQEYFVRRIRDAGLPLAVRQPVHCTWRGSISGDSGMSAVELHDFLLRRARLWLDLGTKFGVEGDGIMRINLACPRSIVNEALERLTVALAGLWLFGEMGSGSPLLRSAQ